MLLDKNTLITVTNRAHSVVGYTIPDLNNLHRNFQPNESKEITMEELRKLSYVPGGQYIIENCLKVDNQEALKELTHFNVEPEYFYTEEDVKKLLLNGTLDEFLDCLDFAPDGVINIIKDLAVKLEINDIAKRNAILEKTGFNVTKAIEINHESAVGEEAEKPTTGRRAAVPGEQHQEGGSARRTAAPSKYKVVK